MDVNNQVSMLRRYYKLEINRVYDLKFQMKLMSVMSFNRDKYSRIIKSVEIISSIIESAVIDCNPKRILKYLVILRVNIDDFIIQVDKEYNKLWDNKLTH